MLSALRNFRFSTKERYFIRFRESVYKKDKLRITTVRTRTVTDFEFYFYCLLKISDGVKDLGVI